jgi:CheY-like chemotaxis protein
MKPVILILDDQVQYLRSLERALRADFDVIIAGSLAEAKVKVASKCALLITDIRLNESNDKDRQGLEFIRWVRQQRPELPILAMSALDEPQLDSDALAAGATKFLRKPIVVSQLKSILQLLLSAPDANNN